MWEQEKGHLELFSGLVERRRVRPTVLTPLWNIAGYMLGTYLYVDSLLDNLYVVIVYPSM